MSSAGLVTGWVRKPIDRRTVVVFIHGILSGGIECWTADNGAYWPTLLLNEPTLSSVGIFVFSYHSKLSSNTYSLGDVVNLLGEEMHLSELIEFSQVIFVCHSMGGIVARRFIIKFQRELLQRGTMIGLFLVASPSLGSPHANLLYSLILLAGNEQGKILRRSQRNQWLGDLDGDFRQLIDDRVMPIIGRELIEDKPILLFKWRFFGIRLWRQTVPPDSAGRFFANPLKISGTDHLTICKPATAVDQQHRTLVGFVAGITKLQTGPIAMSIPVAGAPFGWLAQELVNEDLNGAVLDSSQLTAGELNATVPEKQFVVPTVEEGLDFIGKLVHPKVRPYKVEYQDRVYKFAIL